MFEAFIDNLFMTRKNDPSDSERVERSIERPDSVVERLYNEELDRIGPLGRLRRGLRLCEEVRRMMLFSIRKAAPEISERELHRQVAMRMYLSDDRLQEILRRV